MKITMTNGSKRNGIKGSRLRFFSTDGRMVSELNLPAGNPRRFLASKAGAKYAKPLKIAIVATTMCDGSLARRKSKNPRCSDMLQLFAECKARVTAIRVLGGMGKPAWEKQP